MAVVSLRFRTRSAPIYESPNTATAPSAPSLQTAALRQRSLVAASRVASLTPRQREVLQAMLAGLLNKQIAYSLSISEKTVKMHRAQLMLRLQTGTTAATVRVAVEASFALVFTPDPALAPTIVG